MWPVSTRELDPSRVVRAAADLTATSPVELVTIPDVELCEVGEDWRLSTGLTTFTRDDFESAIAAQDDPFVRTPKIKIGHDGAWAGIGDSTPTFGKVDNMRLSDDGMTLIGDLVGVPKWMADIMASAWPQRSIEGRWEHKTSQGKTHHFVITGVALLGESDPGIETLEDLQALWVNGPKIEEGETVSATRIVREGEIDLGKVRQIVHAAADRMRGVAASVSVEDVRRTYYDTLQSEQMWWWIREVQVDPAQLIVDDDEGSLYRVAYSVSGDEVTFSDPVKVEIQYQDVAASRKRPVIGGAWASKEESRPSEEEGMDPKLRAALVKKFGLAEDADDATILQALEDEQNGGEGGEGEGTPEGEGGEGTPAGESGEGEGEGEGEPAPEATPPAKPEGEQTIVTDPETIRELQTAASNGNAAWQQLQDQKRDTLIGGAIKAGKFTPARKEHFETLYKADPEGTTQLIESMAKGVVPVELRGHGTDAEASAQSDAYPSHWLPEVQAQRKKEEGRV